MKREAQLIHCVGEMQLFLEEAEFLRRDRVHLWSDRYRYKKVLCSVDIVQSRSSSGSFLS